MSRAQRRAKKVKTLKQANTLKASQASSTISIVKAKCMDWDVKEEIKRLEEELERARLKGKNALFNYCMKVVSDYAFEVKMRKMYEWQIQVVQEKYRQQKASNRMLLASIKLQPKPFVLELDD